ncbi:WxL domain-containing protein [Streptomyces sp. NPDC051940]|uniref:WxL domain-containing protein n=1 Tax=Streptomyces sp. NPDC051940 TaxID=3155675 RepID=UPI00342E0DAE
MGGPLGRRRRWAAALAGGTLLLALTGAAAPEYAVAGTVTATVHCVLPAGQGEATGPQDMTVELTPAVVEPGGQVHARVTLGPSPATSGFDLPQVPTTPSIDLAMSGGATGTVTVTGPTVPVDIVAGEHIVIPPYEGDFFVPADASGEIAFAPVRTLTRTLVIGNNFETPCTVTSGGGTVATVTAQGTGGEQATLAAPTAPVKPNTAVPLSGTRWTPGGTPAAALCKADGSGCDAAKLKSPALAIDAAGSLSGTVTLQEATRVPDGSYLIRVNDGTKEATAPLTVTQFVPTGPRAISISPARGPVGTVVRVTGTNYLQDRWIVAEGVDAAGVPLGTGVFVKSTPDGAFALDFTVFADTIAGIRVKEGNNSDTTLTKPFTVAPEGGGGGTADQTVNVTVETGPLSMEQAGDSVDFGTVDLDAADRSLQARLNRVTVTDARGVDTGWSLTGTLTPFDNGAAGSIPANAVTWTPACAAQTGSLGTPQAGTPTPLGSTAATLCQVAPGGTSSLGIYDVDAGLGLQVPMVVQPGRYTALLTLTLS